MNVGFHPIDSLSYMNQELREDLKQRSFSSVADISQTFPNFKYNIFLLDKGDRQPVVAVLNKDNKTFKFYAKMDRDADRNIVGLKRYNIDTETVDDRFCAILYRNESKIGLTNTTLNICSFVGMMLSLIGTFLAFSSPFRSTKRGWLFSMSVIISGLFLLYFVIWLLGGRPYSDFKLYNYPEWITICFVLSEIALLSGVIFRITGNADYNIFQRNSNKLQGKDPIGVWKEIDGKDKIIIQEKGQLLYFKENEVLEFNFEIIDRDEFIVRDKEDRISHLKINRLIKYINNKECIYTTLSFADKSFSMSGESNKYVIEKDTLKKVLDIDYSIWSILGCIAGFILFTILGIQSIVNKDTVGIIFSGIFIVGFIIGLIGGFINKRNTQFLNNNFDEACKKLNEDEIIAYFREALNNKRLTIDEWIKIYRQKNEE